jgi:hypothetical protein
MQPPVAAGVRTWSTSTPPHLVAALDHGLGVVLGQVQAAQIGRTRSAIGKKSVDVVYDEDHSTVHTGNLLRVMAALRSTATSPVRLLLTC